MADFFAPYLEEQLSNRFPGLLTYIKKNDCNSMEDAAIHCGTYLHAAGEDIDTAIDTTGVAFMIHRWREHRMIYKIDPELTSELISQSRRIQEDESLPSDLLLNLPFPCICVETGAFYYTLRDKKDGEVVGRFDLSGRFLLTTLEASEFGNGWRSLSSIWESVDGRLHHYYLPIIPGGTLGDSIDALHKYFQDNYDGGVVTRDDAIAEAVPSLLAAQIVLYLQAQNADIQARPSIKREKKKSKSRNTTRKPPKIVDVGYRIGSTLKSNSYKIEHTPSSSAGSPKRPHVRRGHWHYYWTGALSKPDDRKMVLKWIAPVMVNGGDTDGIPTVIPVK